MKTWNYTFADKKTLEVGKKPLVMGILNVTPDSFSDGSKWNTKEAAISHTKEMIEEGAQIIDVGAESTRPGAQELTADEETERLFSFLPEVLQTSTVPVSIDSYHYETMEKALAQGAHMVNDIWGFQYDDGSMAKVAATYNVPAILMHNHEGETYENDIIEELKDFLSKSVEIALKNGVKEENIILDPGIGFGKNVEQNLEIMKRLEELTSYFPYPWLLGVSRKRFIGAVLDLPAAERDEGTSAVNLWGYEKGCHIFRVHQVKITARQLIMWHALCQK